MLFAHRDENAGDCDVGTHRAEASWQVLDWVMATVMARRIDFTLSIAEARFPHCGKK
jgi:hypothetical protein